MGKILFGFLAMLIISMTYNKESVSKQELNFLANYYEVTLGELEAVASNLSDDELKFRPADGGWSVMECLEHILLAEERLFMAMKSSIEKNEVDITRDNSKKDGLIITAVTNRGDKAKTLKPFEPTGRWKNADEMLGKIRDNRKNVLKLISDNSKLDLRHIFVESPVGQVDMYQFYIIYAAHGYRHTLQIKEILEEQNYK